MNQGKFSNRWSVEVAPEAILNAQRSIESHYSGVARKDMEGWLARFIQDVHDNPMNVLGFPPKAAVSDPDMLYFPGDAHHKVSGLAHASRRRHVIHVYEIKIQLPKEKEGRKP